MARYSTSLASKIITGTATIVTPDSGAFTALTGTAPYTVTLPDPRLYPGVNQTFFNSASGTVTLSTPSGNFNGTGGSGSGTVNIFTGNVVSATSDGVNYVVISEDGSALVATTAAFSGNVDMNGGGATVTISPNALIVNPATASSINNVSIGASTRGSGAFTSLTANAATTLTANTTSTGTSSGTLVVTGGVGVSGAVNAGSVSASTVTGTLQTAAQPNITSVGTLTTTGLTVNGRQYFNGSASFYSLSSFNGSAQWILLGRFTGGTVGETLNLQFYGGNGYNGTVNQHSRTFIQIRTGNGNPVDTNVSVDYHTEGQSSMVLDVRVQNVNPTPIAYGTIWDVYVQINGVCGNAYYIPFINSAATWSHTGTAGVTAPTVSSTVISGTNLFMMNSTSWFGGNIGVGTVTPTLATIDGYTQKGIEIVGTKENGTAPAIRLRETGSGLGAFEIRSNRQGATSGNYLAFGEGSDTFVVVRGDDDSGGTATRGFVGVGTSSPAAKLHVVASTPTTLGTLPGNSTAVLDSSGSNYLTFRNTADNATQSGLLMQDNNVGGYLVFRNFDSSNAAISDRMFLAGYQGVNIQYGTASSADVTARTTAASFDSTGIFWEKRKLIYSQDIAAPTGFVANTWFRFSGFEFNGALDTGGTQPGWWVQISFANLNPSYGYIHWVTAYIPPLSSNTFSGYHGGYNSSHYGNISVANSLVFNSSHHTSAPANHDIRLKLDGSSSYGAMNLFIWSNTGNSSTYPLTLRIWKI